jgi:hypothetical protein
MDTIGTPMKFSACVAENEERTPWEPWRVQREFSAGESTVTVNVPYGMTEEAGQPTVMRRWASFQPAPVSLQVSS